MDSQEKPLFGTSYSYTWTAALADTITSNVILPKDFSNDKGLISLFLIPSSGNVVVTPKLGYCLNQGGTSMSFYHGIDGYKASDLTQKNTTFNPNSDSGFEAAIHQQLYYLPCLNGFKIQLTRASNVQVVFTYAGVHLFSS